MRLLAIPTLLMLLSAPVLADTPIWAKSGNRLDASCDDRQAAVSPSVKSPDETTEVTLRCKNADIVLAVRRAGRVVEIALPMVTQDAWRPQELLWSPDGQQFIVNGSENAYAGDAFVVVNLREPNPEAREITRAAQRDMVKRFPPCKAAKHDREICRRLEREPDFNMSAIAWTRDSHAVIVMAEVPSSSSYGGIMGQVEGYELDIPSGRILTRLSAMQLKARWQSDMAFTMTVPDPPIYGP